MKMFYFYSVSAKAWKKFIEYLISTEMMEIILWEQIIISFSSSQPALKYICKKLGQLSLLLTHCF